MWSVKVMTWVLHNGLSFGVWNEGWSKKRASFFFSLHLPSQSSYSSIQSRNKWYPGTPRLKHFMAYQNFTRLMYHCDQQWMQLAIQHTNSLNVYTGSSSAQSQPPTSHAENPLQLIQRFWGRHPCQLWYGISFH
jgi:hypothetical protein